MIASFTVAITSFDRRQIRHDRPIDRDTFGPVVPIIVDTVIDAAIGSVQAPPSVRP